MLQQVVQHHSTKNMVMARRALPWHEAQHRGTKTITTAQNAMLQHK